MPATAAGVMIVINFLVNVDFMMFTSPAVHVSVINPIDMFSFMMFSIEKLKSSLNNIMVLTICLTYWG